MKQDSDTKIIIMRILPGVAVGLNVWLKFYGLAAGLAVVFILLAIADLKRQEWED